MPENDVHERKSKSQNLLFKDDIMVSYNSVKNASVFGAASSNVNENSR